MQHWYLLMTKPRQDEVAQQNLENQGYQVYRPVILKQKKVAGKLLNVPESFFPRYLFIKLCDKTEDWRPIRSTKGVLQMVRFGTRFTKVPDKVIEELQQRLSEMVEKAPVPLFQKGDKLQVESGAMAGLEVVFNCLDSEKRVVALMHFLGEVQTVTFDAADVKKTG